MTLDEAVKAIQAKFAEPRVADGQVLRARVASGGMLVALRERIEAGEAGEGSVTDVKPNMEMARAHLRLLATNWPRISREMLIDSVWLGIAKVDEFICAFCIRHRLGRPLTKRDLRPFHPRNLNLRTAKAKEVDRP
jgi:hypothetical protein